MDTASSIPEEAVERAARAQMIRKFGPEAILLFEIPNDVPQDQRDIAIARCNEARLDARAALEASGLFAAGLQEALEIARGTHTSDAACLRIGARIAELQRNGGKT